MTTTSVDSVHSTTHLQNAVVLNTALGEVYAAHPCYGNGHKASHRAFWARSVKPGDHYAGMGSVFNDQGGSLLADGFNYHWKAALNLQRQGHNITRFAMLHDDVVPEDGWLGALLTILDEEKEKDGTSLVSVVIPIKDGRGLSSTGLDDGTDEWEILRRLTMYEVGQLPPTFGADDCVAAGLAGPDHGDAAGNSQHHPLSPVYLVVNTGLWVCDFTQSWRHRVWFQIHNRIAFRLAEDVEANDRFWNYNDGKRLCRAGSLLPVYLYRDDMKGEFQNQVMSEDWDFSRQLASHDVTVKATRKISLSHMGEAPFTNQDFGWGGWRQDESLRHRWDRDPYPDVDGWMTPSEGRCLTQLAGGKDVLEIGSYCGKSTIYLSSSARSVVTCDPFDGRGTPRPRCTYDEFVRSLNAYGKPHIVQVRRGTSDVLPELYHAEFGLAFIDGAHDKVNVDTDVAVCIRLLAPDGVLAFHDFGTIYPDINAAVDALISSGAWAVVPGTPQGSVIALKRRQQEV